MSNTLKSVVESGRNVVESGASTLSDLVEEARSRIEDLPPLARPRRRRARRRWGSILLLGLVAIALMSIVQRGKHQSADPVDQTSVRRR
jgi:ferric-dicitrate binding protein FerR (iron transport regulator)